MSEENKNQRHWTDEAKAKVAEQMQSSNPVSPAGAQIAREVGQPLFWSPGKEIAEMESGSKVIPFPGKPDESQTEVPNGTMHQVGPGDPVSKDEMPQEEPEPAKWDNVIHGGGAQTASDLAKIAAEDDDEKNAKDYEALCRLPYIELYTRRSSVQGDLNDLKSSKQMMDQVGDAFDKAGTQAGEEARAIAQANNLDAASIKKSARDFYAEYPHLLHEGQRLLDLMDSMLESFPEAYRHSTTFISQSMVESANIRRDAMVKAENPSPNHMIVLKRLDMVTSAYRDRVNFDPIFQKLQYPHNIRKAYKEFISTDPKVAMAEMDKVFMPVFDDSHMAKFRQAFASAIMTEKMDAKHTNVLVFFMTYWLAKVYEQEFSSGKCAYVKTFIMNFYDMASNMYDCQYGPAYMATVGQTIFSLVSFAATADVPKKQLSGRYNAIYNTMMDVLTGARNAYVPGSQDGIEMPDRTSLIELYPDLDYTKFRQEREIIEGTEAAQEEGNISSEGAPQVSDDQPRIADENDEGCNENPSEEPPSEDDDGHPAN